MNSSIGIDKCYKEMRGLAFHRVSQQEVLSLIDEINQIERLCDKVKSKSYLKYLLWNYSGFMIGKK